MYEELERRSNKITNPYIQNLRRIEFMVTLACSGKCKIPKRQLITNGYFSRDLSRTESVAWLKDVGDIPFPGFS